MQLTREIKFQHWEGDEGITVVLRRPTSEEINKFLKSRFPTVRNKTTNNQPEARQKLINKILVNIEGLTIPAPKGKKALALNKDTVLTDELKREWSGALGIKVETWKDLIPADWKNSWAQRFEEDRNYDVMAPEDDDEVPL